MKRVILGLAVVGMLSLALVQESEANDRFERRRAGGHGKAHVDHQHGRRGNVVVYGGNVVYGKPAPRAAVHPKPRYGHHGPHAHPGHRHGGYGYGYPNVYRNYVPNYGRSCAIPYSNPGGFGYSNGRVSFWIGF